MAARLSSTLASMIQWLTPDDIGLNIGLSHLSASVRPVKRFSRHCPTWGMAVLGVVAIATGSRAMAAETAVSAVQSAAVRTDATTELLAQRPPAVVLQRGDSGEAVSELQRRLTELGVYSGPVTGFFGEMTETAVQEFQRNQGLTADGIVGASTTNALRRAPANTVSDSSGLLRNGSRGEAVTALQRRLTNLGYYDSSVTGVFGPLTEDAVRRFQSANGLAVDGIAGTATIDAIDRASRSAADPGPNPNDGLLEQGETGAEVAQLQRRLQALNYYSGNIDGDFGTLTADAVIRLQRAQGLTADGIIGPNTLAAIQRLEQQSGVASSATSSTASSTSAFPSPSQSTVNQPVTTPPPQVVTPPPPAANPVFPPATSTSTVPQVQPEPTSTTMLSAGAIATSQPQLTIRQQRIMQLQRELTELGFYNGPIDGVIGPATQQAIQAAQNAYGVNTSDFPGATPF